MERVKRISTGLFMKTDRFVVSTSKWGFRDRISELIQGSVELFIIQQISRLHNLLAKRGGKEKGGATAGTIKFKKVSEIIP